MNVEAVKYWFELGAIVLGVFLAVITIFTQASNAVERFLNYLERRKNRRDTRHLLIVPEPSEMAKYRLKIVQDTRKERTAYVNEVRRKSRLQKREFLEYTNALSNRARARIFVLAFFFCVCFAAIAIRIILIIVIQNENPH